MDGCGVDYKTWAGCVNVCLYCKNLGPEILMRKYDKI